MEALDEAEDGEASHEVRLGTPQVRAAEGVRRAALVGLGQRGTERPLLVIEPEDGADEAVVEARLRSHRQDVPATWNVSTIRFHSSFPVDVRHNAKIRREDLKRWAEAQKP